MLLETFSWPRLISFPICGGIVPVRLLFDKSNPKENEEILWISLGMDPSRLLTDKFNIDNIVHCARLAGFVQITCCHPGKASSVGQCYRLWKGSVLIIYSWIGSG